MNYKRMGLIGQQHPWSKQVPNFVKEMSFTERLLRILNEDNTVLLSNALWVVSNVEITHELMYKSLQRMVKILPNLRHCIRDYISEEGSIPVYVEMENPVINLEISQNCDWKEETSNEWEKKYDLYNGPLWKVKLLPNVQLNKSDDDFPYECVIIFSCSHVILDGMSYQMVFGHLLDSLEAVNKDSGPVTSLEVFPCSDYYMAEEQSIFDKLGSFAFRKLIHFDTGRKLLMGLAGLGGRNPYMHRVKLPIDMDPSMPKECKFLPLEFTKEETKELTEACKSKGTTVTGVLHIAASIAFASMLQEGTISIGTVTAVNLRRVIGDELKSALGNYSSVLDLTHKITPSIHNDREEFWESAKVCSSQIKQGLQQKDYLKFLRMLRIIVPAMECTKYSMKEFTTERYGREGFPILITNMGNNEFLSRGKGDTFKLVGRFGGGSEQNAGNTLTYNVNTFNGQMFVTLIYCPHIIKEELVITQADRMKCIIKAHCKETPV